MAKTEKTKRFKITCPSCGKSAFRTLGSEPAENEFACGCGRTITYGHSGADISQAPGTNHKASAATAAVTEMATAHRAAGRFVRKPLVYVLEVDARPILAFEATSGREAQELTKEDWLLDDLKRHRSDGVPLWDGKAKIRVGVADGEQVDEVRSRLGDSKVDLPIVYLVPLD